MFHLVVHLKAKEPSDASIFEYHLGEMAKKCPSEVGCIYYKVHEITEKINVDRVNVETEYLVVETWQSEQHWKEHLLMDAYLTHYKNSILPLLERDVYFLKELLNN